MTNKRFVITLTVESGAEGSEMLAALRTVVEAIRMDIYGVKPETSDDPWCHEHNTHRRCPGCDDRDYKVSGNEGASPSTEESPYKVGQPDPTPNYGGEVCGANTLVDVGRHRLDVVCTWPITHRHEWHVAGNSTSVLAVWKNEEF